MNIMLATASSGSRGGGELYLLALAEGLMELGQEVSIAMSDHTGMDELAELARKICPVHRTEILNTYHRKTRSLGAIWDTGRQKQFREFVQIHQPDLLHINKQNLEDGLDLMWGARSSQLPSLATVHVTRSLKNLGAAGGGVRDQIARSQLTRLGIPLIAVSDLCLAELHEFLPPAQRPDCFSVSNGAFRCLGNRDQYRKQWARKEDEILIGTVARIEAQKNPLFVCDLLSKLPEHIRFVWVGDGSMRGELERKCAQMKLQDRLIIDGWQQDARERLAGLDLFVLPSLYEGFPLAILEAMSAGLACVVSEVDGTRDAIVQGETGYLCPVNDLETWSRCVSQLCEDAHARQTAGAAAKARYEAEFSPRAMAERTLAVYQEVLARFDSNLRVSRQN